MSHSAVANGGLRHAQARKALKHGTETVVGYMAARQAAFGRGVLLTADGQMATTTKARLPEGHAYNRQGDTRCPSCKHVNKAVRASPHTCEHCKTKFDVVFQH